LTAVDPYLSPITNNVICPASNIRGHDRKNVISKVSESEEDRMEPASKNVVNDMSKPAIVNNTKLPIETDIKETDCKRIPDFCTFPNVENKEYVLGIIIKPKIVKLSVKVINKMSESKNDTMGPGSKNVVNDMSKSESFMKGSVLHHSMGVIIPLTFA
jgi:hypothetical protein